MFKEINQNVSINNMFYNVLAVLFLIKLFKTSIYHARNQNNFEATTLKEDLRTIKLLVHNNYNYITLHYITVYQYNHY